MPGMSHTRPSQPLSVNCKGNQKMLYSLELPSGITIVYELVCGRVKNINLRVYPGGRIRVSAPSRIGRAQIEAFICSKESFVLKAMSKSNDYGDRAISDSQKEEFRLFVNETVEKIFPRFSQYNIEKPDIGFRDMKSRWGSCCKAKGWVHFSYRLIFYPAECTEYVVVHELAHLVEPNHSQAFYHVIEEIMPDWKEKKGRLVK